MLPALDTSEQFNPPESLKVPTFKQGSSDSEWPSVPTLVRRHSLSMRSQPPRSIASEVIQSVEKRSSFDRAKNLLSEVRDLSSRLSEYESCWSSDTGNEEGEAFDDGEGPFKTMNERKRGWRKKRKISNSPTKESFLKKQNVSCSPQGPK